MEALNTIEQSHFAISGREAGCVQAEIPDIVDGAVKDKFVRAPRIRGDMYLAEENIPEVDMEVAADVDEKKEQIVYICKFNGLNYYIDCVICNLKRVAEVSCLLQGVINSNKKMKNWSVLKNLNWAVVFSL